MLSAAGNLGLAVNVGLPKEGFERKENCLALPWLLP